MIWSRNLLTLICLFGLSLATVHGDAPTFSPSDHLHRGMFPLLTDPSHLPDAAAYFKVTYVKSTTWQGVRVRPKIRYAELIEAQQPIIGVNTQFYGFGEDAAPRLELPLARRPGEAFAPKEVGLAVRRVDLVDAALPIFYTGTVRELALYNNAWGRMENVTVHYALLPTREVEGGLRGYTSIPLAEHALQPSAGDEALFRLPIMPANIPPRLRDAYSAAAIGYLGYTTADGEPRLIPFCTLVILGMPATLEGWAESATYDVALRADPAPYTVTLPIDGLLYGARADSLRVRTISDRWARYSIDVTVATAEHAIRKVGRVDLEVFAPRSSRYLWLPARPQ